MFKKRPFPKKVAPLIIHFPKKGEYRDRKAKKINKKLLFLFNFASLIRYISKNNP